MVSLTLSEPVDVHIAGGQKLSVYIAAILLYNTFNDAHKHDQPWIRKNLGKLIPLCQQKLKFAEQKIRFPLKNLKNDVEWNVFLNVCEQETLRLELNNLLNVKRITFDSIDFSSNLVEEVMETKRTICPSCMHPLIRKFQYKKNKKGTIGIKYSNKVGPILTINYVHQCSNENCDGVFYHNRYIVDKVLHFEKVEECNQMNSKSSFFDDDIIEECTNFNHDGVSTASYVEKWNMRFEDRINEIESHLKSINQTLGYRKSSDASLTENRLNDAVFFRRFQIAIEHDLKQPQPSIHLNEIIAYQLKKNNKIIINADYAEKTLNNEWIDCNDLFNLLFDKYGHLLDSASMEWVKFVPIKNGEILKKHFLVEGDGSVKINIARCSYPNEFYQKDHDLQQMKNDYLTNNLQCNESPQKGNRNSISFSTCSFHTRKLKEIGCPPSKINAFCKYSSLQRRENNNKNKEAKIKSFKNEDVKLFNKIRSDYLQKKKRRNCYYQTRANMNESLQYEIDENTLKDFESICQENNVNATLLSNPNC